MGQPGLAQGGAQLGGGPARHRHAHVALDLEALLVPPGIGGAHRIGAGLEAGQLGQPLPLRIAADREIEESVRRAVDIGRDELAVLVAAAAHLVRLAAEVQQRQCRDQPRRCGLQHRHVDALPLAGLGLVHQRAHHAGEDFVASLQVDQRHTGQGRRAGRVAGQFHESGHGLDRRVVAWRIGHLGPHGRDAGPDQARLGGTQGLVVDAELGVALGQGVAAEHVDVEFDQQAAQHRLSLGPLEVECDRFLADVRCHEVAAPIRIGHLAADVAVRVTRMAVAARRRLDPDHAPAELREAQRGIGQGQGLLHRQDGARFHAAGTRGVGRVAGSAPCSAR